MVTSASETLALRGLPSKLPDHALRGRQQARVVVVVQCREAFADAAEGEVEEVAARR